MRAKQERAPLTQGSSEISELESSLLNADAGTLGLMLLQLILHERDNLCGHARAHEGHQPCRSSQERRRVSRDVFPLPLQRQGQRLLHALGRQPRSITDARKQELLPTFRPLDVWRTLLTMSLNCMHSDLGPPKTVASCKSSSAQQRIAHHLHERAKLFCGIDPISGEIPRSPVEPLDQRLKGKMVRYDGEICVIAHRLTAAQLEPALPPEGTAGQHELLEGSNPELRWFLKDPDRCRKPESEVTRPLHRPKVMAGDDEWDHVARVLVHLGVCRVIEEEEIPWFEPPEIDHYRS